MFNKEICEQYCLIWVYLFALFLPAHSVEPALHYYNGGLFIYELFSVMTSYIGGYEYVLGDHSRKSLILPFHSDVWECTAPKLILKLRSELADLLRLHTVAAVQVERQSTQIGRASCRERV